MDKAKDPRRRAQGRSRILERVLSMGQRLKARLDEPRSGPPESAADRLSTIEARVERLESAFEGLQDAVYRDAQRNERQLADLRREIQPDRMAQSLSRDARERGL